jgi:phosphoglycerate dehydrogenase-like enzyme
LRNKKATNWEKYPVLELRGATMGVVGYGDIGKAAARLAHAYGMKIQAMKRRPASEKDPLVDVMYGNSKEELLKLFASCDYILCAMPLTPETRGMIGKAEFDSAKKGAVFVNVGRGPIVDEEALIAALKDGRLKGAGLDVFATEPLSAESPLWTMDNCLLSPHNMDMTETFMQEATEFFLEENLPRFVRKEKLLNPVNPAAGY